MRIARPPLIRGQKDDACRAIMAGAARKYPQASAKSRKVNWEALPSMHNANQLVHGGG